MFCCSSVVLCILQHLKTEMADLQSWWEQHGKAFEAWWCDLPQGL
jgi:hypothetical protein